MILIQLATTLLSLMNILPGDWIAKDKKWLSTRSSSCKNWLLGRLAKNR